MSFDTRKMRNTFSGAGMFSSSALMDACDVIDELRRQLDESDRANGLLSSGMRSEKSAREEVEARVKEIEQTYLHTPVGHIIENLQKKFKALEQDFWATRDRLMHQLAESQAQAERMREVGKAMVEAYDRADEAGIFADHGEHDADLTKCPGCACDVASEDLREALSTTLPAALSSALAEERKRVWEEAVKAVGVGYGPDEESNEWRRGYTAGKEDAVMNIGLRSKAAQERP